MGIKYIHVMAIDGSKTDELRGTLKDLAMNKKNENIAFFDLRTLTSHSKASTDAIARHALRRASMHEGFVLTFGFFTTQEQVAYGLESGVLKTDNSVVLVLDLLEHQNNPELSHILKPVIVTYPMNGKNSTQVVKDYVRFARNALKEIKVAEPAPTEKTYSEAQHSTIAIKFVSLPAMELAG